MIDICTAAGEPLCKNTVAGKRGSCNECVDDKVNRVCVSETEYSICNGGKVLTALKYICPPDRPYCQAAFTDDEVTDICTDQKLVRDPLSQCIAHMHLFYWIF